MIHTASGTSAAPIRVGGGPFAVVFSRNGAKAYAIDSQTGRCAVIDTATGRVMASIPVAPYPVAVSAPPAH